MPEGCSQKPTGSSKTGQAGCPKGTESAYEDGADRTGSDRGGPRTCNSTKVAASTLSGQRKAKTLPTSLTPPTALGPTAFERATSQSTYAIVWQQAKILSVVAIDINVPASSSTSTTAPTAATPLTAKQQQTLSNAALAQDKQLK